VLGGQEDTAVGQLQAGVGAQVGEPDRGVVAKRQLLHFELRQRCSRGIELALTCRSDEHFRDGDRAAAERPVGGREQRVLGPSVQRVAAVQVRDERSRSR
jgi:hypothetical protein